MKIYCILLFLFFLHSQSAAQPTTFSKVFSNYPLNAENGFSGIAVPQGYMVVSTLDCETFNGNTCCGITFLNEFGDIQWFKEYSFYPNGGNTITVHNNKIYIVGHTNNELSQFTLFCLDFDGNVLWNKEYGSFLRRESYPDLILINEEYLLLAGARMRSDGVVPDEFIVKVDLDGNLFSQSIYGIENDGSYHGSIRHTLDGQILFTYTYCPESCFHLWKGGVTSVDDEGNEIWYLDLPTSWFPDRPFTAQIDDSEIVTYWHSEDQQIGNDPTPSAFYFLNMQGEVQDSLVLHSSSVNHMLDLEGLIGRGLVGCGQTFGNNNAGSFAWIVRIGPDRTVLWNRRYSDTTYAGDPFTFVDIQPTSDNGFIAVGTLTNEMTGVKESHTWFVKLDSSGCYQPGCGETVYVSTHEEPKFLKGIGMEIFPNPASDLINLRLPEGYKLSSNLRAVLLDAQGRRIIDVPFSEHEFSVNITALPEGMYYVTVRDGNEILTSKKVVKVW